MHQKTLTQLIIIFLIIAIFLLVYLKYFNENSNSLKEKSKATKIEANLDNTSNYIENVNYISSMNENKYQITAQRAKIKIDKPDIMFLEGVVAYITIKNNSTIKVTSNFAKYNSKNYDTVFSKNIVATYPNRKITGEYLDFSFIDNIGTFSTDIVYTGGETKMFADKIEMDLITNDTKIFMFDSSNKILIKKTN
jgi:hypothetical protein